MRCKRTTTLIIISSLIVTLLFAEDWMEEGKLQVEHSINEQGVQVSVIAPLGGFWLGCSFRDGKGKWFHLNAKKTYYGEPQYSFYWKAPGGGDYAGTVALWKKKVTKEECARRNRGEACSYCKKMGYHLEGELARRDFSFFIDYPIGVHKIEVDGLAVILQIITPKTNGYLKVYFSDDENTYENTKPSKYEFDPKESKVVYIHWTAPRSGHYSGNAIFYRDDNSILESDNFDVDIEE